MDHLSSSQITLYLQCSLKYRFQYVDRLPKPFRSSALVFGGALHAALAWLHEQRMKGKPATSDTLFRVFESDWYGQKTEEPIRYKDKEDEMTLIVLGKEMLALYLEEEQKEVRGCEVPFTVPLIDPANRERLGMNLEGYFDLIEADGTIVEFKTSATPLSRTDINSRLQFTAYAYAYHLLHKKPAKGIRIVNFVKGKKPKLTSVETQRDENDYLGFLTVAKGVLKGITSDVFTPNPSYLCTDCEYAVRCPLWQRGRGNGRTEGSHASALFDPAATPTTAAALPGGNGESQRDHITHQPERSTPMGNNGLFSATVKSGRTTYFVDVKEAKNGNKYLSVTESRFDGESKRKTSIRFFGESVNQICQAVVDAAASIEKSESKE